MQGHFGNDVGVLTQEIDQRGIGLRTKFGLWVPFFTRFSHGPPDADLTPDSDVLPGTRA